MAKLYFKYGTMDASKSAELLMTAYKYEQQGKQILCLRPDLDTRTKNNYIESRALMDKRNALCISKEFNIYNKVFDLLKNSSKKLNCILIDESQFLTRIQVEQLIKIVDNLGISIICYGLKNSYVSGQLFEGSEALLYYADSIQEIKSICHFCDKKATMNLRIENGIPVRSSENNDIIKVGDVAIKDSYYIPTCRKHYFCYLQPV